MKKVLLALMLLFSVISFGLDDSQKIEIAELMIFNTKNTNGDGLNLDVKKAFKDLVIKKDDFEKIIMEKNKNETKTDILTFTIIKPISNKKTFPLGYNMRIGYYSKELLGFKKIIIATDNKTYEKNFNYLDGIRDISSSGVYEYYDIKISLDDKETINMLKDIVKSKSSKIRFYSREKHKDKVFTDREKKLILNFLAIMGFYHVANSNIIEDTVQEIQNKFNIPEDSAFQYLKDIYKKNK